MITGIGTDVLDIERIHGILAGKNKMRFLNRLLTVAELERVQRIPHVERVVEFIAGRFALKEAVAKAFGCGIGGMVGFQDIEIKAEPSGKPQCTVTKEALERLKQVALEDGNIFEELMDAVKYASLGQISNALYEVGGQYRRNM